MVQSGLVDDPRVSQYRLAAHLALALAIYAAKLWIALGLLLPRAREAGPRAFGFALAALVFVQAIAGSFVAGIRAGLAYNTFPLMNGHLVPPGMLVIEPWYLNLFNNIATVQFDHRLIAWVLAALVPLFWLRTRSAAPRVRLAASLLLAALVLQIALGIATLVLVVPVPLAAAHQAGALLVFTAALFAAHSLR
jgi:cytochrome c oxidase assembly protein subunit 15